MKVLVKTFSLDTINNINVEYIEKYIKDNGFDPLRWAIVKIENNKLLIDAVVIDNN